MKFSLKLLLAILWGAVFVTCAIGIIQGNLTTVPATRYLIVEGLLALSYFEHWLDKKINKF